MSIQYLTSEMGYEFRESDDVVIFHLRTKLSEKHYRSDQKDEVPEIFKSLFNVDQFEIVARDDIPSHISMLMDLPNRIEGITVVGVHHHEVIVIKAKMFSWDELFPAIQEHLEHIISIKKTMQNIQE